MNTGYSNNSTPSLNGLIDISADTITSSIMATNTIVLNGVDVSAQLNQVPINTSNITNLQQITTGITYNTTGDLTTIDNNVTVSATKILKSAYAAQANEDVANKLYVDNKVANTVGITYSNAGAIDLTTIDNNVTISSTKVFKSAYSAQANEDVANKLYVDTKIANLVDSAPATLDTLNELAAALGDDVNFSTTITTLIGTKASLSANQELSGTNLFSNVSNTYYGSGANLSGVNSSTLTTWNMPLTGTFYPTFINSSSGASGLAVSSINQIAYDRTNNTLTVPYLNSFGYLKMTSTDVGTRAIYNTFYSFMDTDTTAGGTQRGTIYADSAYVYLTLNSGHKYMINIGGVNLFDINSTALNCTVPISSTSTVSGATLQTSGNINLTNTSAWILATAAGANLSVGTQSGGGGLFLNGQGITGIVITGTYINQYLSTTFTYPPICSTPCSTSTQLANKAYVDSVIPSLTNYVTKDTNQIITGEKTFNGNLYTETGFFGRNDAFAFNTYTGRMPIGYCGETITATTKPVSTVPLITDATIGLTKGVWQVTGYLWLSRGNGTFLANSRISVLYPVEAGLKIYPNSAGLSFLIPHTNTSTVPMVIPVGTLTIVCTGSGLPRQPVERTINMTVGTTTSWYITFSCVKIA